LAITARIVAAPASAVAPAGPGAKLRPMRYVAYKVVEEVNFERLEKAVSALLHEGWEPHGSLVIVPRHDNEISDGLFQPMVKIERDAK
jgi:hypothetical protein